ncbi:hypothetical protein Tco_1541035 [Tanacetum coccineum]
MDWLSCHRAIIDCCEKIIRIPLSNGKILEVQGERPEKDPGSLACIKADEKKLDDIRIGHFKKECPRMKNNKGNRGNQAGNDRAPAKVYVVGNAGANPDNVVAAFSSQIDITPSTLYHYYDVELHERENNWVKQLYLGLHIKLPKTTKFT